MDIYLSDSKGFIGSHLALELEAQGHAIIENMEHAHVVVHNGAISNSHITKPEIYEKNTIDTFNRFEYCNAHDIPFIFLSSQQAEFPETSHYAMSKYLAEQYIRRDAGKYDILRLSNVYGDLHFEADWNRNPSIVTKIVKGTLPMIYMELKRDFIHVSDVCDAIVNLIKFRFEEVRYRHEYPPPLLDIVSGIQIEIEDLHYLWEQISKTKTEIPLVEIPEGMIESYEPKNRANWINTSISIKEYLTECYQQSINS